MTTTKTKKTKTTARRASKTPHRHSWGPMEDHGWEDGTYQVCETCGATRFRGDRYAYRG
jgi:hypothetical protein